MTSGMTTRRPPRTPQVDPVRAALERLAQAQEATQAELHDLIVHVRHLTEAQRRTEERLEQLAARVDQLAEAQRRTEERLEQLTARVDALAVRVDALAVRVDALAVRVDQLAEAQRRTEEELARLTAQVTALTARVGRMDGQLCNLLGRELERSYRELAHAYFADILASIHVVSRDDLAHLLDTAVDAGAITQDERRDVLFADLVLQGPRPSSAPPDSPRSPPSGESASTRTPTPHPAPSGSGASSTALCSAPATPLPPTGSSPPRRKPPYRSPVRPAWRGPARRHGTRAPPSLLSPPERERGDPARQNHPDLPRAPGHRRPRRDQQPRLIRPGHLYFSLKHKSAVLRCVIDPWHCTLPTPSISIPSPPSSRPRRDRSFPCACRGSTPCGPVSGPPRAGSTPPSSPAPGPRRTARALRPLPAREKAPRTRLQLVALPSISPRVDSRWVASPCQGRNCTC